MGEANRRGAIGVNPPIDPEFTFQRHSECEHAGNCALCGCLYFEAGDRSPDELKRYVASLVDELLIRDRDGEDLSFFIAAPVGVDPSKGREPASAEIHAWYMRCVSVGFSVSPNGDIAYTPIEPVGAEGSA